MSLHPPTHRREKILAYGGFNSGKSSMAVSVANWRRDTKADFDIYLADTERGWEVVDDGGYGFVHATDLDVEDYKPWVEWAQETKRRVGRDDWLVVDLHKAWEASEIHYFGPLDILAEITEKHRQFSQGEKGGESMGGAYGGRWAARRRWYNAFHLTVMNAPCHILCIAHAEELRDYHSAEVKAKYKVGWKPEGDTGLPTMFNSVIYCAETPDSWIYTSVREKGPVGGGRRLLKAEPVEDFVQTYLIPIAGWRP